MNKVLY